MTETINQRDGIDMRDRTWLTSYYFTRAAFSSAWVGAAFALAHAGFGIVAALLLIYPTWDAAANLVDARRHGGPRNNPTQAFNAAVSSATAVAIAVALTMGMHAVLGVFGVWAGLSGILQLATGVRRWKSNSGQWPMVLSGIQSTAAGANFIVAANATEVPQITAIAPYAAFGAFYFFLSAAWLAVGTARRKRATT